MVDSTPLNWQTPIVDPATGYPSAQFLKLWQQLSKQTTPTPTPTPGPSNYFNGSTALASSASSSAFATKGSIFRPIADVNLLRINAIVTDAISAQYRATIVQINPVTPFGVLGVLSTSPYVNPAATTVSQISCILPAPVKCLAGTSYALLISINGTPTTVNRVNTSTYQFYNAPSFGASTFLVYSTILPTVSLTAASSGAGGFMVWPEGYIA